MKKIENKIFLVKHEKDRFFINDCNFILNSDGYSENDWYFISKLFEKYFF